MHRMLTDAPSNLDVDHIDMNPLNNQKSNLRLCTRSQNMANTNPHKDNILGLKGVHWSKNNEKYVAMLCHKGKRFHLGCFDTPEDAKKAYDRKARLEFGEFAK